MKILFVSSEAFPFASTGGLGVVAGALPRELIQQQIDVVRILPLYRSIDRKKFNIKNTGQSISIPMGNHSFYATIWKTIESEVPTFFIQNDHFFDRAGLYGDTSDQGYEDNFERFLFFQKSIVQWINQGGFQPDLVHCNDWQTGLLPYLLRYGTNGQGRTQNEKTLFTIHNLAHQGWAPEWKFHLTGFPPECYTMQTLEFYGEINPMKGGIVSADAINAVSPTYAKEIQTPEFGYQLDGVLREHSNRIHGILNGIDYSRWNPKTDPTLPANYSAQDLSNKTTCKHDLQTTAGLPSSPRTPLLGMVTRLDTQKGVDILLEIIDQIAAAEIQLVLLGSGDAHYETAFQEAAARHPKHVATWIEYSDSKARRIMAGADLFLMPSAFEPCGQSQLCSMRYGTPPIVHAVGGLSDSVIDASNPSGTGFAFNDYSADTLFKTIQRAIEFYHDPARWNPLIQHAMTAEFSIQKMASNYSALYETLVTKLA